MGGLDFLNFSSQSQTATAKLSVSNSVLQSATSKCSFTCNNTSSGNTVIITDSTVGNIDFSQTCAIQGTACTIKTYLDTNITTIMAAMAEQNTATMNPIGISIASASSTDQSIDIEETVYNSITQLVSNNCAMSVSNSSLNNYYYFNNSTVGNVNYAQSGSISNADCVMDTIVKATASTDLSTSTTQKSGCTGCYSSGSSSTYIYIIIAIFVIILLIAVIMFFMRKRKPNMNMQQYNASNLNPNGGNYQRISVNPYTIPDLSSTIDPTTVGSLARYAPYMTM